MSNFFPGNPGPTFYQKSQSNAQCCTCKDCNGACYCYTVIAEPNSTISYVDCNGAESSISVKYPVQYSICAQPDSVVVTNGSVANPVISLVNNGPCANNNCDSLSQVCYCFTVDYTTTGTGSYTDCSGNTQDFNILIAPGSFSACMSSEGPTYSGTHTITFNGVCNAPESPCQR